LVSLSMISDWFGPYSVYGCFYRAFKPDLGLRARIPLIENRLRRLERFKK
jgi:hypothetical protein